MKRPVIQRILGAIQNPLPLTDRPFQLMAEELHLPEGAVLDKLKTLQKQGLLREVSAIFNGRKLGYQTALVAVSAEDTDRAASYINSHPGVSHNYRRNHRFNLWFTFASPPGGDIEEEIAALCAPFRPEAVRFLPALKTYKLRVNFNKKNSGKTLRQDTAGSDQPEGDTPIEVDPKVVRTLQSPWPLEKAPWPLLARRENLDADYLMEQAEMYCSAQIIRRISGVVRHRKIGFTYNSMNCFILPDEQLDEAGAALAAYPEVSHCYHRKTYSDWPYNLYAMSHSKSREEAEELIRSMAEQLDYPAMETLYSDKEYKKERVRYFLEKTAAPS